MKSNTKSRPYAVYVVEGEGEKAFWTKIGAAFAHEDGEGLNILLTAVPVSGRMVIRKPKAKASQDKARRAPFQSVGWSPAMTILFGRSSLRPIAKLSRSARLAECTR